MIWGHISDEVAQAARQDIHALKTELRSSQESRWSAVGFMKCVLSIGDLPWNLKKHALDFLLTITLNIDQHEMSEDITFSLHTSSVISTLQVIFYRVLMSEPVNQCALFGLIFFSFF